MKEYGRFVKQWYDYLEQGKIMAVRCKECGSYEFPPVYCCRECSGTDMEWVEISGDARVLDIADVKYMSASIDIKEMQSGSDNSDSSVSKSDSRPAVVQLAEGPTLNTRIYGVSSVNKEELYQKLPVTAKAFIVQCDGFKTVAFMYEDT